MREIKGVSAEPTHHIINKIDLVLVSPRSSFEVTKLLFPERSLDANENLCKPLIQKNSSYLPLLKVIYMGISKN